jgi:hypothetical protein
MVKSDWLAMRGIIVSLLLKLYEGADVLAIAAVTLVSTTMIM